MKMDYIIKQIETDESSLIAIAQFLSETFPKSQKFTLDFVRWQYAQNPLGQMVGFNAWDNGVIVSHFATLPICMNLYGIEKKGLLCINVGTNKDYRGKNLFTILGKLTFQLAKEKGCDFLIAVPNANSTHAFVKYFDFYLISQLTVKVGFGKNIFNAKQFPCYKSWDSAQKKWRLNNPTNSYSYSDDKYISSPISFFAKTLSTMKLDADSEKDRIKKIGLRPLNLYIGLGANTKKGFYFNIPSFVKRPPFNLVFRDLKGDLPIIKKEDIFLQLIDLDTI